MKKVYFFILICVSLIFTGCTNADVDNFLNGLVKITGVAGGTGDAYLGEHVGNITLPSNSYYNQVIFTVKTNNQEDNTFVSIDGNIYNKANKRLDIIFHIPYYNKFNEKIKNQTLRYTVYPGYSTEDIKVSDYLYSSKSDFPYTIIKNITIAIYCQGELIGTNNEALMKKYLEGNSTKKPSQNLNKTLNKTMYKQTTKPAKPLPQTQTKQQTTPKVPNKRQSL